jgi:hypothetical protein
MNDSCSVGQELERLSSNVNGGWLRGMAGGTSLAFGIGAESAFWLRDVGTQPSQDWRGNHD